MHVMFKSGSGRVYGSARVVQSCQPQSTSSIPEQQSVANYMASGSL